MTVPQFWTDLGVVHDIDTTADFHRDVRTTALTNGTFLITYLTDAATGVAGTTVGIDLVGQIRDGLGRPVGGEFLISQNTPALGGGSSQHFYEIAATFGGGFGVAYRTATDGIDFVEFASNLTVVNTQSFSDPGGFAEFQSQTDITTSSTYSNGTSRFVSNMFQFDDADPGFKNALDVRTYDVSTGTFGSFTRLATVDGAGFAGGGILDHDIETLGSISLSSNRKHVVAWIEGVLSGADTDDLLRVATFGLNGVQSGSTTLVEDSFEVVSSLHVASFGDDRFLLTYAAGPSISQQDVYVRLINTDLSVFGSGGDNAIQVNTGSGAPGSGQTDDAANPVVLAPESTSGTVYVFWLSPDNTTIFGRNLELNAFGFLGTNADPQYTAGAAPAGSTISTFDATMLDDGRIELLLDYQVPGEGTRSSATIFDPRGGVNPDPARINSFNDDSFIGTQFADTFTFDSSLGGFPGYNAFGWTGSDTFTVPASAAPSAGFSYLFDGGDGTDTINIAGGGPGNPVNFLSFSSPLSNHQFALKDIETFNLTSGGGTGTEIFRFSRDAFATFGSGNTISLTDLTAAIEVHYNPTKSGVSIGDSLLNLAFTSTNSTFTVSIFGNDNANYLESPLNVSANLYGNGGDDRLVGDSGNDNIFGGEGADIIDGFTGNDFARFDAASGPVVVYLANDRPNSGEALGDTYFNVEGLIGSSHNDFLFGDDNPNFLYGQGGSDSIAGGLGADVIDGGEGIDFVRYDDAAYADDIRVYLQTEFNNLNTGVAAAGDTYNSIENLQTSVRNDTLFGNDQNNLMLGNLGIDNLYGFSGNDTLFGGNGDPNGDGVRDNFVFTQAATPDTRDTIGDFERGIDQIALASSVFGIDETRITFNTGTKELVYTGASGTEYNVIAILTGETAFDAGDFYFY